ncbi:hypothetical protein GCM10027081_12610 [Cupriavidus yeoncheonensis]
MGTETADTIVAMVDTTITITEIGTTIGTTVTGTGGRADLGISAAAYRLTIAPPSARGQALP